MAVLLYVLGSQIKFFVGEHLLRCGRCFRRLCELRDTLIDGLVGDQLAAICLHNDFDAVRILRFDLKYIFIYIDRRDLRSVFCLFLSVDKHKNLRFRVLLRTVNADIDTFLPDFHVQDGVDARIFHLSRCLVGHKVLFEYFFLIRFEPCEVRLVITVHTCHELYVRPILIREISVPGFSEIAASPCPLLFPGRNMMIRHMEQTGLLLIVVSSDEVVFRTLCHVGSRNRNILISGYIHALAVIVLVILTGRNRKTRYRPLAMVVDTVHVRRENGLRIIVDGYSRVCPPQECLRKGRSVVELTSDLNISLVRIQRKSRDFFRAVHLIDIPGNDRAASIRILPNVMIDRRISRRSVMLRPVELYAARNPRSGQAYQRGLDYSVVIYEIIVVCLIVSSLDPPAQFGKNHDFQIFVLEIDSVPNFVRF